MMVSPASFKSRKRKNPTITSNTISRVSELVDKDSAKLKGDTNGCWSRSADLKSQERDKTQIDLSMWLKSPQNPLITPCLENGGGRPMRK